ncbi:hypothetical protein BS47DRAFT_1336452 [Hydnum rufescens UP504]|uniref:Uncharacterized protein n=1 Tax=Hydnum rufescens UP504 TaxID=1448309 RepID=A0A9P6B9U0_9AGAM|nr:hypothetical protein BS47DRAFT_1336452 [Hydnum rufescens UP504]
MFGAVQTHYIRSARVYFTPCPRSGYDGVSIRLERGPLARHGAFSRSHLNFPTNDMSRVSEMESRLVTEDLSRIAAIVEFDTPPTLDNLRRLLDIISEESKIYNVLKENCWFYATVIQDLLTDWCEGNLHGTLSHLTYGGEGARKLWEEIMGV